MEFDIDFGNLAATPKPAADAAALPMYAAVDGRAASLSNNECVFQARDGGELHVMTHQVLQALDQCREFRSLDQHMARVAAVLPGLAGRGDVIRQVLVNLIERGVLVSDQAFLAQFSAPAPPENGVAPLSALAIRACDRPARLERLLLSLQDQARAHGRRDPVLLLDDSRDADSRTAHAQLLHAHGRAVGAPARHVDDSVLRGCRERLARARPEAAASIEALFAPAPPGVFSGGRGYNLALLLTAGRRLSLLDDDYQLPFHRASHAVDGLQPVPSAAFESRFHASTERALAAGSALAEDGFALQEQLVGHTLAAAIANRPELALDRALLRNQSLSRLSHLRGDARILATFTGTRGASFTGNSHWLYRLSGPSRQQFWADREGYLRNIHADTIEYAPSRVVARRHGAFTPFLLDNSALLPCTASAGRGEDALFGVVASYLHPASLTLHLPITIGHVQEGRRDRYERAKRPQTPGVNQFLNEWILNQAQPSRSADPVDRLAFLAAQLDDLAGASDRVLIEALAEYLRYVRADAIEQLQQQLMAEPEAPVYWVADVRQMVEVNGRALLSGDPPRLDEWPEDLDAAGCAARLRLACRDYSDALRHWPALWHTAADLGDRLLDPR